MKPLGPVAAVDDRILQAIGLMCLYVALIVVVNAGGKVLTESYHAFQIVLFRQGVAFLLMVALFLPRHGWRILVPKRPGLQIVRGLFGIASSVLYFIALASVSLATAAAISFTAPLAVTALSAPLLGERVGLHRWAAVAAGFAGALIIIRPGFGGTVQGAALLLVVSAGCSAMYQIITRKLAGQDHAETTNIWSGLVGSTAICLMVPFVWQTPGEAGNWALFVSLGLFGGSAHYLLTKAFERAPASLLSPFNYLHLLGAAATGYLLFADVPDRWTWIGAAVIVAAGLYIARRESRRRQAPRPGAG
ncbi:MAG: DMT family transporter [Alphaproteobacteria bacterium]|nr:DMT family transporter [Alphaproteobacteria bacterium]